MEFNDFIIIIFWLLKKYKNLSSLNPPTLAKGLGWVVQGRVKTSQG